MATEPDPLSNAQPREHADGPPHRVTDEWLLYARRNPTKIAAWVLRSVIDELIDRRLTERSFGDGR